MVRTRPIIILAILFLAVSFLLILSFPVFAQEFMSGQTLLMPYQRQIAIEQTLDSLEGDSVVIENVLRNVAIELTLEYAIGAKGEQSWELVDEQGVLVSRLEYPHRGEMLILKGEVGFKEKFFLGGRYGSSQFRKRVCSDEDWSFFDPLWGPPFGTDQYVDYQITRQLSKSKVDFFDINFYYRFLDLDQEEAQQRRLAAKGWSIFDFLLIDNLSSDVFVGYQQQNGKYRMIDPMNEKLRADEGSWYYASGYPADIGLDSFYKVKYQGPRIGFRAKGSRDKLTATVSCAYSLLETEASGFWNLRDLSFYQEGKNGYGIDIELGLTYRLTSFFSAGVGFNYLFRRQADLKMYAVEDGTPWWEGYQDRIRNVDSEISCPSLILKFIW
jgi:hypothetical protein